MIDLGTVMKAITSSTVCDYFWRTIMGQGRHAMIHRFLPIRRHWVPGEIAWDEPNLVVIKSIVRTPAAQPNTIVARINNRSLSAQYDRIVTLTLFDNKIG